MSILASALIRQSMSTPAKKTRARAEAGSEKRHYRPLPKEFQRGGFTYKQLAREGNAAIYEQRWSGCRNPSVCYEVIRIRRRDGFQIGARFVEPAEIYPNSEAWGVDGFTVQDKETAFRKLREIIASPTALTRFGQQEVERWISHCFQM
jgi:hypothetical protein